jgi:hypothetical protein
MEKRDSFQINNALRLLQRKDRLCSAHRLRHGRRTIALSFGTWLDLWSGDSPCTGGGPSLASQQGRGSWCCMPPMECVRQLPTPLSNHRGPQCTALELSPCPPAQPRCHLCQAAFPDYSFLCSFLHIVLGHSYLGTSWDPAEPVTCISHILTCTSPLCFHTLILGALHN